MPPQIAMARRGYKVKGETVKKCLLAWISGICTAIVAYILLGKDRLQ
jgi:hypothetical protein